MIYQCVSDTYHIVSAGSTLVGWGAYRGAYHTHITAISSCIRHVSDVCAGVQGCITSPYHTISHHIMWYHDVSWHMNFGISENQYHLISRNIMTYHDIRALVYHKSISHYITLYHIISQHIRDPVSDTYHKVISQTRYHKLCDMAYFVIWYQEAPYVIRSEKCDMSYHEISGGFRAYHKLTPIPYHTCHITYITSYQSISARYITAISQTWYDVINCDKCIS